MGCSSQGLRKDGGAWGLALVSRKSVEEGHALGGCLAQGLAAGLLVTEKAPTRWFWLGR